MDTAITVIAGAILIAVTLEVIRARNGATATAKAGETLTIIMETMVAIKAQAGAAVRKKTNTKT